MKKVEELTLSDVGRNGEWLAIDQIGLISTFEELISIIEKYQDEIDILKEEKLNEYLGNSEDE